MRFSSGFSIKQWRRCGICKAINGRMGQLVSSRESSFMRTSVKKISLLSSWIHYRLISFLLRNISKNGERNRHGMITQLDFGVMINIHRLATELMWNEDGQSSTNANLCSSHTTANSREFLRFRFAFQWLSCHDLVICLSSTLKNEKWMNSLAVTSCLGKL